MRAAPFALDGLREFLLRASALGHQRFGDGALRAAPFALDGLREFLPDALYPRPHPCLIARAAPAPEEGFLHDDEADEGQAGRGRPGAPGDVEDAYPGQRQAGAERRRGQPRRAPPQPSGDARRSRETQHEAPHQSVSGRSLPRRRLRPRSMLSVDFHQRLGGFFMRPEVSGDVAVFFQKLVPPMHDASFGGQLPFQGFRQTLRVRAEAVGAERIAEFLYLLDGRIVVHDRAPHGQGFDDARTEAADQYRVLTHRIGEASRIHRVAGKIGVVLRMLGKDVIQPRPPASLDRRRKPALPFVFQDSVAEVDVDHRPFSLRRPEGLSQPFGDAREADDLEFTPHVVEIPAIVLSGAEHPLDGAVGVASTLGIDVAEIVDPFHDADRRGARFARVLDERTRDPRIPVVEDDEHVEAVAGAEEIGEVVAMPLSELREPLFRPLVSPDGGEMEEGDFQAVPSQPLGDGKGRDGVIVVVEREANVVSRAGALLFSHFSRYALPQGTVRGVQLRECLRHRNGGFIRQYPVHIGVISSFFQWDVFFQLRQFGNRQGAAFQITEQFRIAVLHSLDTSTR